MTAPNEPRDLPDEVERLAAIARDLLPNYEERGEGYTRTIELMRGVIALAIRPALVSREAIALIMLRSRNVVPNTEWDDGMTEGVARIEMMLAEKAADAILALLEGVGPQPR